MAGRCVLPREASARCAVGTRGAKIMSDVTKLREDHPHWRIDTAWTCTGSGPDRCELRASRAGITVRAWTAQALAHRIAEENRRLATRN